MKRTIERFNTYALQQVISVEIQRQTAEGFGTKTKVGNNPPNPVNQ